MEQTVQKQRVAIYCRVASDSGDHSHGYTAQKIHYTEMVGKRPDWELAGIYADTGITSADQRTHGEFKKLLTDCKQGKVDIILVRSISRFARNMTECLKTVGMLKAIGVGVIFELEDIDTRTESGELCTAIVCKLAQRESEALARHHEYPMVFLCRCGCIHMMGRKG